MARARFSTAATSPGSSGAAFNAATASSIIGAKASSTVASHASARAVLS